MQEGVFAEISAEAVRGNVRAIRARAGEGVSLCAAVKADAYGHGIDVILPMLAAAGVERVAVASLDEAVSLREGVWHRPILCLGAPLAAANERELREKCRLAVAGQIDVTVSSLQETRVLAEEAARLHTVARVQIKVDSGMGRMGLLFDRDVQIIVEISRCPGLRVEGVYTHFATADEADDTFARQQLSRFLGLREQLRECGVAVQAFHAANSAAIFRLPDACRGLDLVRPGICLYGYWDGPANERPAALRPAMRVISHVAAVRQVPADYKVGYGCTFTTQRPSTLGVVPVGYADGYRRLLSNDARMTLTPARGMGRRIVPVVGRVSMDQTILDLTEAGDVRVGDPVVVIDNDPAAPNSVEALARKLGTISYEITCLIGRRVRRLPAP
jgi:alanine racemase